MKQMSNKKANIAISENNKLIVTQNSQKNVNTDFTWSFQRCNLLSITSDFKCSEHSREVAYLEESPERFNFPRVLYLLIQLF